MIISNDRKNVMLQVPKNGTLTTKDVLSPYGTWVGNVDYMTGISLAKTRHNITFDDSKKIYAFWRDPVERFISIVNYFRSPKYIKFLMRFRPNFFTEIDLLPYKSESLNSPFNPPQEIIDACLIAAQSITPEQIFNDKDLMSTSFISVRQSTFYKSVPQNELIIFDFANFEENLRKIAIEFGAPTDIVIPKLNESVHLTTSLSPELEAQVKEYYAEDYLYKPT